MRKRRPGKLAPAVFVAAQVRYIPVWTWIAQAAIVALMCIMAQMAGDTGAAGLAVGVLSAATVLAGVPTATANKLHDTL